MKRVRDPGPWVSEFVALVGVELDSVEWLRQVLAAFDNAHEHSTLRRAWYSTLGGSATRYDGSRYHGVNLNSLFYRGTVEFRWFAFSTSKLHAGEVKTYVQFVLALVAAAKKRKSASRARREYTAESAKYDFRVFLLGLGMIGDEFKTARHHLLKNLPGSSAWKRGRPPTAPAANANAGETADDGNDSDDGGTPAPRTERGLSARTGEGTDALAPRSPPSIEAP